jgi:hypothetical protein
MARVALGEALGTDRGEAIVERLEFVRALGLGPDRERRIHRARYAILARETAVLSAQHLYRFDAPRRLATLVVFAREMEAELTDAALGMFDKMMGRVFRKAEQRHQEHLLDRAKLLDQGARALVGRGAALDPRGWEVAVIVTLRDRLRAGDLWVEGSRAFRAFDDFLLPPAAFAAKRQAGELGLAVPDRFEAWRDERLETLARRLREVAALAAAGQLPEALISEAGLSISPIRQQGTEAEELARRLYGMLPRLRITELLAEVQGWTGFVERFVHLRTGAPPEDPVAVMTTVLADATNLGLARMAHSSGIFSPSRLLWTAEWHLRDETYQAALACLVDAIHAQPFSALWGEGDTSSSDGQLFRAGGPGEARADHNAHYGAEPGLKFYTHLSDRFGPYYTQVIAANASEAPPVLDGLLHHESSLAIREHYTDTGGAAEHVFGLCHLLGFRFAPRRRTAWAKPAALAHNCGNGIRTAPPFVWLIARES